LWSLAPRASAGCPEPPRRARRRMAGATRAASLPFSRPQDHAQRRRGRAGGPVPASQTSTPSASKV
jgi:hypothetical protein